MVEAYIVATDFYGLAVNTQRIRDNIGKRDDTSQILFMDEVEELGAELGTIALFSRIVNSAVVYDSTNSDYYYDEDDAVYDGLTTETYTEKLVVNPNDTFIEYFESSDYVDSAGGTVDFPTTNILAYYKLDTDATDAVGSNDGSVTGASLVTGKINDCYDFNGSSDEIGFGDMVGVRSISMWVKSDVTVNTSTNNGNLFGNDAEQYFLFFGGNMTGAISNEVITFHAAGNKYMYWTSAQIASIDTGWHHLVITFPTTTSARLYVDGDDKGLANLYGSPTIPSTFADNFIGSRNGQGYYGGLIDEVGVWTSELSQADIDKLYNSGDGLQYGASSDVIIGNNSATFTSGQILTSKLIYKLAVDIAAVTVNATIDSGVFLFEVSPDGGTSWETVTPGVRHIFTTVGNKQELKYRITENNSSTGVISFFSATYE